MRLLNIKIKITFYHVLAGYWQHGGTNMINFTFDNGSILCSINEKILNRRCTSFV